jgi:hypothetical protein
MPSKEVVTFRIDMTAPMTLLSRVPGATAPVERAMRVNPAPRIEGANGTVASVKKAMITALLRPDRVRREALVPAR